MSSMRQGVRLGAAALAWFGLLSAGWRAALVRAADAPGVWKVGLARADITPQEPVRMAGYASRTTPSQGVASRLYAKAMAIEDEDGNQALLITSDVIGFPADFAEPTCRRMMQRTGLSRRQILLTSAHVHTGPVISLEAAGLDFPPEQAAATVRYGRRLQAQLVELAERSLADLRPARLSWGLGVALFVMNRREFTDRGVILGVNPRGLADRSVLVVRVDDPAGRPRAVLYGAACHCTTLTGRDLLISGDFAGYSQQAIEAALPGAQAMFVQGCAGDANPYPRGSEEIARRHGEALGAEVLRVVSEPLKPLAGPLGVAFDTVDLPLEPPMSREEATQFARLGGGWRRYVAEETLKLLDAGRQPLTSYAAPVAVWQFGDDLTLVALPGEVVVDYVALLERALGPLRLWVAAYANDVFGYIPSARTLAEGGYETRGLYHGGVGLFRPEVQDVLVRRVVELARRAGRKW